MNWDDYGISRNRYAELKAFCLQYEEKKNKISRGLKGVKMDGQPHSQTVGNPTENAAIQNAIYQADCDMIVMSAKKANAMIAPFIIRSVTNDLSYQFIEYDKDYGRIPVGRSDFYAYRRLFYYYLDEMQKSTKRSR